jgi:hypothetical protein
MIRTSSLYEVCHELFTGYPLAAEASDQGGQIVRSMVLMLRDGGGARFFVLGQESREGRPSYSLRPWGAAAVAEIEADDKAAVSDVVVNVVTHGVPIPQDGSLFGWTPGDAVTALVATYARYTPACPEPSWAVMPLAGIPETQWPPFTDEHLFGHWFWEYYRAGRVVLLDGLIAGNPDTVYWVATKAVLGSDSCAVARDITSLVGPTLQRGCYVYYEALQAGKLVPPLAALLADTGKIDLASRFRTSS